MMDTKKLRLKILDLAIRGKLVPQDPNDEPASVLVEKIRAEKERLIKEKKIKRDKNESHIYRSDKSYYEKFADGTVKCIDDEIPFDIPESWMWCRLGNITQHNTGKTLDKGRNTGCLHKYITTSNLYWDRFDLAGLREMPIEEAELDRFTAVNGDLLICEGGDAGRSAIWEYEQSICFQNHIHRVRPYIGIDVWYLYYFMLYIYGNREIKQYLKGVGIQSLSGNSLASIVVPVPPVAEQISIVSSIKSAFTLIDDIDVHKSDLSRCVAQTKSKILDLAIRGKLVPQDPNDEPASELLERIKAEHPANKTKSPKTRDNSHYPFEIPQNWVWCSICDVCDISPKNKIDDDIIVSFIPMTLISEGFSNEHKTETRKWRDVKKGFTYFQDGDVGIAKITPCFENRKSVIFQNLKNGYGAGTTELHILRPTSECLYPNYLLWFVKTDSFIENGVNCFTGAVGQQRIGSPFIKGTCFPLPPLAEQQRIVKKIEEIFAVLDTMGNSIQA